MLSAYYIVDKYHSIVDVVINTVHFFKFCLLLLRAENHEKTAQYL